MKIIFITSLSLTVHTYRNDYDTPIPKFKDFSSNVLERHIKVSRHLPVCVIYRKTGEGSKLEDVVHELWRGEQQNYTSWEFGSYAYGGNTKLHYRKPSSEPLLRCFLGLSSSRDYTGPSKKAKVNTWLNGLVRSFEEQIQDATEDLINNATNIYNFTVVAFPDHLRHSEIEELVFQISEENYYVKAFISHMHSLENRQIRLKYDVHDIPSVLIIYRKCNYITYTSKTVYKFSQQKLSYLSLDVFVRAKSIPAPHYTATMFERAVIEQGSISEIPKLITFYSHWAPGIYPYLSAMNRTIEEFRNLGINLIFGLVDVNDEIAESRKIIHRYINSKVSQRLPFTLLYYKDINKTVDHIQLPGTRPTPMTVYTWLSSHTNIASLLQLPQDYFPYGQEDPSAQSHQNEGPYGKGCYITSHNQTDNEPQEYWWTWRIPQKKQKEKKAAQKSWHDVFGTDSINKKLQQHDTIPLLSRQYWSEVIEKSHAPLHPFLPGREWAGEVTKVALVIFIMADCRSCKNGMETFKNLQNSVKYIAGGSVYLVNCTEEVELCKEHDIRGFPTVTAFRGLGWLESSSCISDTSRRLYRSYTRMDYHGVLQAKPIMSWFGEIAGPAVKDRLFDWPKNQFDEDVRLVGVLIPKGSRYLPLPPARKQNYYYSYECYRLVCERLYGKAKCYSVYSQEVPQKEFKLADLEVIVSKIMFQRKDGIQTSIMQVGHTLSQSLENEDDVKLHMFHKAHRYSLRSGQRCEDDHSACTDVITAFTMDHARLPITQINSNAFHTTNVLNDENLPILIALVYKDNMTDTAVLSQTITQIAYQFYNEIVVMTLDVEEYPAWAGQFVPKEYTKQMIKYDGDPNKLFEYPRFCIVQKSDHNHAAFYPPLEDHISLDWFDVNRLKQFILDYLEEPNRFLVPTEHF